MDWSSVEWHRLSGPSAGCAEVAVSGDNVAVRDSTDPANVVFTRAEFAELISRGGELI